VEAELEAAMRKGMKAVFLLGGEFIARAMGAKCASRRAEFLMAAGECYLTVSRNIPTPHHEVAVLSRGMANSCLLTAAVLRSAQECAESQSAGDRS